MLSTMRSSWLLFALLALVALSAAFSVEDALNIDGINAYLHHGEKRQAQGTGPSTSADAPSTSAEEEPSSTPVEPSSTPDAPSTSAPAPAPSTSAPPEPSPSDDAPSSPAQQPSRQSSSADAPATTPNAPPTPKTTPKASAVPSTKALISTEVQPITTIVTITSNGQNVVHTSVGSRTIEHTTGTMVTLPTTEASNSGGGLSSTNKSIIGGVVGGVGGAILLGGIALVCWRMWGKKKRVTEDDADLMAGTGSALGDKSHSSASPFQSNLEQYHNPGGRPNAAANF